MKNGNTVIISSDKRDLFRIHIYKDCIKFDAKFAEAIFKDEEIRNKAIAINRDWVDRKLKEFDVLQRFTLLIESNKEVFEDYYFQDYELNKEGKYVDLVPLDSLLIDMDKKAHDFYEYLLGHSVLTEIDKKEFELNIKSDKYKDLYVELYDEIHKKKGIKFFKYNLNDNFGRKMCCFVATDKQVFFGYVF